MRFTRSQACAQAAEEAQAALLQAAELLLLQQAAENHTLPLESLPPLPTILKDVLLEIPPKSIASCHPSSTPIIAPSVPSFQKKKLRLPLTSVRGLPVLGLKRRQEQYRTAL
jgi:hypothetical protein